MQLIKIARGINITEWEFGVIMTNINQNYPTINIGVLRFNQKIAWWRVQKDANTFLVIGTLGE